MSADDISFVHSETVQLLDKVQSRMAVLRAELGQIRAQKAALHTARLQLLGSWSVTAFNRVCDRQAPAKQCAQGTFTFHRDDEAYLSPHLNLISLMGIGPGAHAVEMDMVLRRFPPPFRRPQLSDITRCDLFLATAVQEHIAGRQAEHSNDKKGQRRAAAADPREFSLQDWEGILRRVLLLDTKKNDEKSVTDVRSGGPDVHDLRARYFWLADEARKQQSSPSSQNGTSAAASKDGQSSTAAALDASAVTVMVKKQFADFYSTAEDEEESDIDEDEPLVKRVQIKKENSGDDDDDEGKSKMKNNNTKQQQPVSSPSILYDGLDYSTLVQYVAWLCHPIHAESARNRTSAERQKRIRELLLDAVSGRNDDDEEKKKKKKKKKKEAKSQPQHQQKSTINSDDNDTGASTAAASFNATPLLSAWDRARLIMSQARRVCATQPWSRNDGALLKSIVADISASDIGDSSGFAFLDRFAARAENPFRRLDQIRGNLRNVVDDPTSEIINFSPTADLEMRLTTRGVSARNTSVKVDLVKTKKQTFKKLNDNDDDHDEEGVGENDNGQNAVADIDKDMRKTIQLAASLIASGNYSRRMFVIPRPHRAGKKGAVAEPLVLKSIAEDALEALLICPL